MEEKRGRETETGSETRRFLNREALLVNVHIHTSGGREAEHQNKQEETNRLRVIDRLDKADRQVNRLIQTKVKAKGR